MGQKKPWAKAFASDLLMALPTRIQEQPWRMETAHLVAVGRDFAQSVQAPASRLRHLGTVQVWSGVSGMVSLYLFGAPWAACDSYCYARALGSRH